MLLHLAGCLAAIGVACARHSVEDIVSAPRPQDPILSPDRSHAISLVDKWDPKSDKTTRGVYLMSLETSTSPRSLFFAPSGQVGQVNWINDNSIVYLNGSSLYLYHTRQEQTAHVLDFPAGVNPTGIQYNAEQNVLVFSGQVWEKDGDFDKVAEHDKAYEERGNSGVVWDELFIRHWDTFRLPGKVWTLGQVSLDSPTHFENLLRVSKTYSKMDPIEFSTAKTIAFLLKTPGLNYATHTRTDVYTFQGDRVHSITPHSHGAISELHFSKDGKALAWLEMAEDGYEADYRSLCVLNLTKPGHAQKWAKGWEVSPAHISWADNALYVIGEDKGRAESFRFSWNENGEAAAPVKVWGKEKGEGSVSSIHELPNGKTLVTRSSFRGVAESWIDGKQITNWSDIRLNGAEEFWFKGADGHDVMGWTIKPPGFTKGGKYPYLFWIHGGPQGAWNDGWSTRWNPSLFAEQGYIVVMINPTGSTGYGQRFTDRIQSNWGGRPYKDLLAGHAAALVKYPEIDRDRTAAMGGSYGGYMINWIQGHNDQFGFKTLVCHDGIFNTVGSYYETEEVWFPQHEFEGSPTETRAMYEKWNPMNFVGEWNTPELVIHGALDFRLPDTQGFTAFTALQTYIHCPEGNKVDANDSRGVPSRMLWFPDENHWVLKPHNSMKWHKAEIFRWLDEWIGKPGVQAADEGTESMGEMERLVIQA